MERTMSKELLALMVAGYLLIPHITEAFGNDRPTEPAGAQSILKRDSWGKLTLPPIPYLDTMPWLVSGSALKGPKVDLLLDPDFGKRGPFLAENLSPPTQLSSTPAVDELVIW
jgi:hypothetical protein